MPKPRKNRADGAQMSASTAVGPAAVDATDFRLRPARSRRDVSGRGIEVLAIGDTFPGWGGISSWLPAALRTEAETRFDALSSGDSELIRFGDTRLELRRIDELPDGAWAPGTHPIQKWIRDAVGRADARGDSRLALLVLPAEDDPALPESVGSVDAVAAQVSAARYRFDAFRSTPSGVRGERRPASQLDVTWHAAAMTPAAARRFTDRSQSISAALSSARSLGNTPPNVATPEWMAAQARALGGERGFRTEVWGPAQLRQRGLMGTLSVGHGSINEPRFVRMRRPPAQRGPGKRRPVAPKLTLVGKGVTFDSGGISIKPSASMEEMKFDKCGACTALALACLLADLDVPIDLEVLLPFAENLPDARATRPSDIITYADGTTVEVINTDAEGRLLLADAFLLAAGREPDLVLEFSTLTGAAVVAVGERAAAYYTPDDRLAEAVSTAAAAADERFWRMPLWPEDRERMKGQHADLRNSSDRWGSANTAAAFLSHFARDLGRWAHLDIAGPAYSAKTDVRTEAGATGFGVLTGLRTVEHWLA